MDHSLKSPQTVTVSAYTSAGSENRTRLDPLRPGFCTVIDLLLWLLKPPDSPSPGLSRWWDLVQPLSVSCKPPSNPVLDNQRTFAA